ncbi:response regulator transcription factor [Actinospica durhamensis]|uniref:response regulator transcription factor n=1 Tax=Actinospica durhamensis TaxID=1508375 RepID=UPI0027DCCEC8|nr:response regulator transcription factor [Actinospica durhamensis]
MSGAQPDAAAGPARVLVVDDHPIWRDAVVRDLAAAGFDVRATAGDGEQAVRILAGVPCDIAVLDLHLPGLSGPAAIKALLSACPGLRILVLSASGEQQDVLDAVKAGAGGYLLKSASSAELVDAARRTAAGDAVFTPGLAALVLGEYRRLAERSGEQEGADTPRLTERETQVLRLVATGLTYRQIAERLVLSHRTVQNHVQNTLAKLQLHNRVELVRYALDNGLGDEDD